MASNNIKLPNHVEDESEISLSFRPITPNAERYLKTCGVLNRQGKPCQRVGVCPFHLTSTPLSEASPSFPSNHPPLQRSSSNNASLKRSNSEEFIRTTVATAPGKRSKPEAEVKKVASINSIIEQISSSPPLSTPKSNVERFNQKNNSRSVSRVSSDPTFMCYRFPPSSSPFPLPPLPQPRGGVFPEISSGLLTPPRIMGSPLISPNSSTSSLGEDMRDLNLNPPIDLNSDDEITREIMDNEKNWEKMMAAHALKGFQVPPSISPISSPSSLHTSPLLERKLSGPKMEDLHAFTFTR